MKNSVSGDIKRYNNLIGEINAAYHDAALKLGLSDSVLEVLYTLCCCGGSAMLGEIIRLSGLAKQTVNSAIRRLEGEGFICLEAVGAKAKLVGLTECGQQYAESTVMRIINAENEIFASWKHEEVIEYTKMTERYLIDIRKKISAL